MPIISGVMFFCILLQTHCNSVLSVPTWTWFALVTNSLNVIRFADEVELNPADSSLIKKFHAPSPNEFSENTFARINACAVFIKSNFGFDLLRRVDFVNLPALPLAFLATMFRSSIHFGK